MEKKIKLKCINCNKDFEKSLKEHKRQIKNGNDRFFCSLSCVCFKRNEENPPKGNLENLKPKSKDQYTPFRYYVNRGNYRGKRKKKLGCDLTVEFLKELWEKQNEICPFTGCKLILPKDTAHGWDKKDPYNASLDRIDNSIGYMKGNVRFISVMANLARQTFTDEQLINFCKYVTIKNI